MSKFLPLSHLSISSPLLLSIFPALNRSCCLAVTPSGHWWRCGWSTTRAESCRTPPPPSGCCSTVAWESAPACGSGGAVSSRPWGRTWPPSPRQGEAAPGTEGVCACVYVGACVCVCVGRERRVWSRAVSGRLLCKCNWLQLQFALFKMQ